MKLRGTIVKRNILKRVLIFIMILSGLGFMAVCIACENRSSYEGKYVFAGENETFVVEVREKDDVYDINYLSSKYGSHPMDIDYLLSSYMPSTIGVDYREYNFQMPRDLADSVVRVGIYDENGGFYTNIYLCFADRGVYFSEEEPYIYNIDEINKIDISNNPAEWVDSYVSWIYAEKNGYDIRQITAVIKSVLACVFTVSGVVLAAVYIRRASKIQQIIATVITIAYGAAAFFFLLTASYGGTYISVEDDEIMTGYENAEFIDNGDSGILMIEYIEEDYTSGTESDEELPDDVSVPHYISVLFSHNKDGWYSVDSYNLQLLTDERVTVNTDCSLKKTINGIRLTLDDSVRDLLISYDFESHGIYRIVDLLKYAIIIPAVLMTVFLITGVVKRSRERHLNPQYPYGRYVIKKLIYINPDMEYMQDYLIRNLTDADVVWEKELFSVNGNECDAPSYRPDFGKENLSGLCGMKRAVNVMVNRLKSNADSYRLAYNKKKTVFANVVDDCVVAAFELEVCHE